MPHYNNKISPDKEYMHKVMCSLYPEQIIDLIKNSEIMDLHGKVHSVIKL